MNQSNHEIAYNAHKFDQVIGLIGLLLKLLTAGFCVYWLFDTLKVLGAMHPSSLEGLSKVIEKLKFGDWLHYILTASLGSAWYVERQGKKRAIRKLADSRRAIESGDKFNESSKLDANGDTPKKLKGK
jgi:hypothetical protein